MNRPLLVLCLYPLLTIAAERPIEQKKRAFNGRDLTDYVSLSFDNYRFRNVKSVDINGKHPLAIVYYNAQGARKRTVFSDTCFDTCELEHCYQACSQQRCAAGCKSPGYSLTHRNTLTGFTLSNKALLASVLHSNNREYTLTISKSTLSGLLRVTIQKNSQKICKLG